MGFENNFNDIYFHLHFYLKTDVKSPEDFFVYSLALETYSALQCHVNSTNTIFTAFYFLIIYIKLLNIGFSYLDHMHVQLQVRAQFHEQAFLVEI